MTSPLSPEAVAQMVADLTESDKPLLAGVIPFAETRLRIRKAADMLTTLAAENATLRAEFELLTAVKNAHKMRADSHWETLRSIRVLAREGKLEHIIQHVSDAGAGYTQPDEVTMWELQAALATANDELATRRASEAAALERVKVLEAGLADPVSVHANMLRGAIAMPSFANIKHLYAAEFAALTPTADKEPKT